ncbi:hypothetical protein LX32DRAFT_357490 [Colletotrichum zoysiae]|uniref:Uncharacterized protein n=1 Tax=Colletotrichum zoysiae TaxID=1216348 RepID=A0AAD9HJT9_9PEZI|nr:hypothetical protein LX32DRAFT_357490 [Colletotrichum zoysiae]
MPCRLGPISRPNQRYRRVVLPHTKSPDCPLSGCRTTSLWMPWEPPTIITSRAVPPSGQCRLGATGPAYAAQHSPRLVGNTHASRQGNGPSRIINLGLATEHLSERPDRVANDNVDSFLSRCDITCRPGGCFRGASIIFPESLPRRTASRLDHCCPPGYIAHRACWSFPQYRISISQ